MKLTRINNVLIDLNKIIYVLQVEGFNKIQVKFDSDVELFLYGAEAAELWKLLDGEKDWRDEGTGNR